MTTRTEHLERALASLAELTAAPPEALRVLLEVLVTSEEARLIDHVIRHAVDAEGPGLRQELLRIAHDFRSGLPADEHRLDGMNS